MRLVQEECRGDELLKLRFKLLRRFGLSVSNVVEEQFTRQANGPRMRSQRREFGSEDDVRRQWPTDEAGAEGSQIRWIQSEEEFFRLLCRFKLLHH